MKQPMTFRLFPDVAEYLQSLEKGNQTKAVEDALRRSKGFRDWNSNRVLAAKQKEKCKMSDKGYLLPAIEGGASSCGCCGATKSQLCAESRIAVGFGDAKLTKDGETIWSEIMTPDHTWEDCMSVAQAEDLAKQDPDHDWRIVIYGPLRGMTYQRHGDMQWMLVEKNDGFA